MQTKMTDYKNGKKDPYRTKKPDYSKPARFQVGHVYVATTYRGSKRAYEVIKINEKTGYITFQEKYLVAGGYGDKFSRIPLKDNPSLVTIQKGTYGRVCWTGGFNLSAYDELA